MLNALELTGRTESHIVEVPELGCSVHWAVAAPLRAMHAAARSEGLEIAVLSSFRAFERQVEIWNAKFRGERPLYDRAGRPLEHARLETDALIEAILAWSALPGASRHHWGTDVDVADGAVIANGYRAQLLPAEFAPDGVFARLEAWMQRNLARFGFFRPYRSDRGGVQPEAWHVSFAPLAAHAIEALSLEVLREAVAASSMLGREAVLARLPELYTRFVRSTDPPPDDAELQALPATTPSR